MLLLGPMLEEKYGSKYLMGTILITAVVTGLVNYVFFPYTGLCGASGVVFAFILLASFTSFRMTPDQLPEYIQTLEGLREDYKDRIELHIGLEEEYFPILFPDLLALLEQHSVEYLILGQHRLGDGVGEFYYGAENTDEGLLSRYCDQCMEAMNTGLFTYSAHPDIFNYVGDEAVYRRHMSELCREANRCQMPVEVNSAGLREGIWYPNPCFGILPPSRAAPPFLASMLTPRRFSTSER